MVLGWMWMMGWLADCQVGITSVRKSGESRKWENPDKSTEWGGKEERVVDAETGTRK
jgi:hypothetical protein